MATIIRQIQVRRDTAANWTSVNPVLANGEVGFETNTEQFKIGTGADAWAVLPYQSGGDIASVNGQTGTVVLDADDLSDAATTKKFTTAAQISKLAGIETNATSDQTASEIKTLYEVFN